MDSSSAPDSGGGGEMASELLDSYLMPDNPRGVTLYTSGRLLKHLLAGMLLRPGQEDCETHELLLIGSQSGVDPHNPAIEYVSCICNLCRHRFHITATGESTAAFQKSHPWGMHLYACAQDGEKSTESRDDPFLDRKVLVCVVDGCHCRVELERLRPRLTPTEIRELGNKARMTQHLREARESEPDRFQDATDDNNAYNLVRRYLNDGLQQSPNGTPLKMKVRNKKFTLVLNGDFDALLRSLGFELRTLEDKDDAWVFPVLEPPSTVTPFGTRRAKWEDADAELVRYSDPTKETRPFPPRTSPAWETLHRIFRSIYKSISHPPNLQPTDVDLLGCLADYEPRIFVEITKFLSNKCPSRREEFLKAADRLVNNREHNDAQMELVMYSSQFDSTAEPAADSAVLEAFKFFNTTPGQQSGDQSADYFISKYYAMADADQTDGGRLRMLQNLQLVGDYLGKDLMSVVGQQGSDMTTFTDAPYGSMNLDEAQRILEPATLQCEPSLVESVVNRQAQEPTKDRAKLAAALETFSLFHRTRNPTYADQLENWAGFFKDGDAAPKPDMLPEPASTNLDPKTPPGLRNIGNTCYLNSLLQYLYTVKAVRNLAQEFPQNSLELSDESVQQRKLGLGGGTSFSLEEAIIGRQFVEELQSLFQDLQTTTRASTAPSQKLANTALCSASELLRRSAKRQEQQENKPPPLPARPSPTPPESAPADAVNVTVQPVLESVETASEVSSQTLVNEEEGNSTESFVEVSVPEKQQTAQEEGATEKDTKPAVADVVVTTELRLEDKMRLIAESLEYSERKGTDQQDVEEIMGFILEHLMHAVRSSGPTPGQPSLQADIITTTFFPQIVNYTGKLDESGGIEVTGTEVAVDRWINTFPVDKTGVSSTIYQALFRAFVLEFTGNKNEIVRFSAIRRLPPVLHIHIQRLTSTSSSSSKNKNPVVLYDELFMDRFMDCPQDSQLAIARRAAWALEGHDADGKGMEVDNTPKSAANGTQGQDAATTDMDVDLPQTELGDGVELVEDIFGTITEHASLLPRKRKLQDGQTGSEGVLPPIKRPDTSVGTGGDSSGADYITRSISQASMAGADGTGAAEAQVETFFGSLRDEKYRLHAVICHSGGATAGHYWVWIRDFERNAWVKFNDSTITVDTRDPQAVLDELNQSGDPCYVAYVRDSDKEAMVDIPQRVMPDPSAADPAGPEIEMQTIEGIAPDDHDGGAALNAPFSDLEMEPRPYDLH